MGGCRQFSSPPRCEKTININVERQALRRCHNAIKAALDAYPTTLEEDELLLPTLEGLPLFLVTLRRDEKWVLKHWLRYFGHALELADSEMPIEEIGDWAAERYGRDARELNYLRVTLAALVTVELGKKQAKAEEVL